MSGKVKIALIAVFGILAAIVLAGAAILLFADLNEHKPRIEAAASDALGMDVKIGGRVGIGFFPGFHATLDNVRIVSGGTDFIRADKTHVGVELLPLLRKEVRIGRIGIERPGIRIERGRDGKFNFERRREEKGRKAKGKDEGAAPSWEAGRISLKDGSFLYIDLASGEKVEARNFDMEVPGLRLAGTGGQDILERLSFEGDISCRDIQRGGMTISDLRLHVAGNEGVLDIKPMSMRLFGGQGSGSVRADLSGAVPVFDVRLSLSKFRLEEFLKSVSAKKTGEGPMDFTASLTMRGKTAKEMRNTSGGSVSLRGEKLTLIGVDIDRIVDRFEKSQKFDLLDAGAFFFAGPFGPLLTKGYDFAGTAGGEGGNSRVRRLVSDWKVERGVAHATDVAMATDENRIALKGRLDFVGERFDDVTVALIDGKGCALAKQKIRGPFRNPEVEKASTLRSLAGPVLKLLGKTRDIFRGKRCDAFYAGSVAPP